MKKLIYVIYIKTIYTKTFQQIKQVALLNKNGSTYRIQTCLIFRCSQRISRCTCGIDLPVYGFRVKKIRKLVHRCHKCIEKCGDYIDK